MPRTYKRVLGLSRRRKYSQNDFYQALSDVLEGRMTARQAAQNYNVLRRTLDDRVSGRHGPQIGTPRVLSEDVEVILADNIATMADWGFPMHITDVRSLVKDYVDWEGVTVPTLEDNRPGEECARSFLHRQRRVLADRVIQCASVDEHKITAEECRSYFDRIAIELQDVPPSNVINFDETALSDDPG